MFQARLTVYCRCGLCGTFIRLVIVVSAMSAPGCGTRSARSCDGIAIWNATDKPIADAAVRVGKIHCPGGSIVPGGVKISDGFAIWKYETALVTWSTSNEVRHEEAVSLKALPKVGEESQVWFRIGDEGDVTVLVVGVREDPRFATGPMEANKGDRSLESSLRPRGRPRKNGDGPS